MDITTAVTALCGLTILYLFFWIPSEILRKAGFARGWTFIIPLTGFLAVIVFALSDWPIQLELAWYRLRDGETSEATIASAEKYAVHLENAGDWRKAAEVFEELARRASTPDTSDYYRNCVKRLREKSSE